MRAFIVVLMIVGCGGSVAKPVAAPVAETPKEVVSVAPVVVASVPETPKEPADVTEFKAAVKHYLAEARAGAKLIELAPTVADMRAKSKEITELLTHLPDVPASIEDAEFVGKRIKNINGSFFAAVQFGELAIKASGLKKGGDLAQSTMDEFLKSAKRIREACNDVESKLELK